MAPQHLLPMPLEIEHIIPRSAFAPGDPAADDESNLWLACAACNKHKSDKTAAVDPETELRVALFNPRKQVWAQHFRWSDDGLRIIGLTPVGRATVRALHLDDDPRAIITRGHWAAAGWHPPQE
ncbi:MAG: HNH endonuclease [Anaerolineae bacterium]|nr:HNH endonuclease [Anaerolineae bacterium]